MYLITELAQNSLKDHLSVLALQREQGMALPRNLVRSLAQSICLIVAGLHAKRLVHTDLRPEHFLFFDGKLKLADVDGCVPLGAEIVLADPSMPFSACHCAPERARLLTGAEELLEAQPSLDTWSVGMTLCELVTLEAALHPLRIHCSI